MTREPCSELSDPLLRLNIGVEFNFAAPLEELLSQEAEDQQYINYCQAFFSPAGCDQPGTVMNGNATAEVPITLSEDALLLALSLLAQKNCAAASGSHAAVETCCLCCGPEHS